MRRFWITVHICKTVLTTESAACRTRQWTRLSRIWGGAREKTRVSHTASTLSRVGIWEGYAISQPRVTVSVKAAGGRAWQPFIRGDSGFDIYNTCCFRKPSYQDLFGRWKLTPGKGIYEVETFQKSTGASFPPQYHLEPAVLIEGAHARAGFISDIGVGGMTIFAGERL